MPRIGRVKLLKKIKHNDKWTFAPALFDSKGRVRRDHVTLQGKDEAHPEGVYFQWWSDGTRTHEAVGADAFVAAERARRKQAELDADRNGLLEHPRAAVDHPDHPTLADALTKYEDYIRYHRSLRTLRTYRPILQSFGTFCTKARVDDVDRQDLLDYATDCLKAGQKGKTIYNKLVVISQVMKQHGKAKMLNAADWPSFVETVRPIYEDAELAKLFKACNPAEEMRYKFYLMSGFRDAEGRFVTWRDVDFKHMAVRVTAKPHSGFHPKNSEEREGAVPPKLVTKVQKFRPRSRPRRSRLPERHRPPRRRHVRSSRASPGGGDELPPLRHQQKLKDGTGISRCSAGPFCGSMVPAKFSAAPTPQGTCRKHDIRTLQQWMGHRDISRRWFILKGVRNADIQNRINKGSLAAFA
jgi:integrase